jgi:hypothetical protein
MSPSRNPACPARASTSAKRRPRSPASRPKRAPPRGESPDRASPVEEDGGHCSVVGGHVRAVALLRAFGGATVAAGRGGRKGGPAAAGGPLTAGR